MGQTKTPKYTSRWFLVFQTVHECMFNIIFITSLVLISFFMLYECNIINPFSIKVVQWLVRSQRLLWNQLFAFSYPKNLLSVRITGSREPPTLCWSRIKNCLRHLKVIVIKDQLKLLQPFFKTIACVACSDLYTGEET